MSWHCQHWSRDTPLHLQVLSDGEPVSVSPQVDFRFSLDLMSFHPSRRGSKMAPLSGPHVPSASGSSVPPPALPRRMRAIDLFTDSPDCAAPSLPSSSPFLSFATAIDSFPPLSQNIAPSLPPSSISSSSTPRAIDLFNSFPSNATDTSVPSDISPLQQPSTLRAIDLLTIYPDPQEPKIAPDSNLISEPRPIAKLPRRARRTVDLDLTLEESDTSDVIELTDTDDDTSSQSCPPPPVPPRNDPHDPQYVFNTHDLLSTRQAIRGWRGTNQPNGWVLSRDEFHSDQVDKDRLLPLQHDTYPSFAISAGDLQSLHRYLMARYDVETLDEYVRLLALFRNTRAIESEKARARYEEIAEISASVEMARISILRRLEQRRSSVVLLPEGRSFHM